MLGVPERGDPAVDSARVQPDIANSAGSRSKPIATTRPGAGGRDVGERNPKYPDMSCPMVLIEVDQAGSREDETEASFSEQSRSTA